MEKIVVFGEHKNLFGIFSETANEKIDINGPAVLILNAGLVNRAGPFRMNAELAEVLSNNGCNVLRFDLSGIGDSERPVNDGRDYNTRNLDDIGEAVDCLEQRSSTKNIVVIGLCTGADLAHRAASRYSKVSGCILLDGYGFKNMRFYLGRYSPVFLNPVRLFKAVASRIKILFFSNQEKSKIETDASFSWKMPTKDSYISDMEKMYERNVMELYVYTGGVKELYNYKNQFSDVFSSYPFSKNVEVQYMENSDHTFIILEHRKQLFKHISSWLDKNFNS